MLTADQFRSLALALPGAAEGEHMNHPDFRANGRVFASLDATKTRGMAVLTPVQQRRMLQASSAFAAAKGAWGRQGCTMIDLATALGDMVRAALTSAWENAMAQETKATRKASATRGRAVAKAQGGSKIAAEKIAAKKPLAKKPGAKRTAAKQSTKGKPAAGKPAGRKRGGAG